MIIFYHNDLDGRASAAAVAYSLSEYATDVVYVEVDYTHNIDSAIESIEAYESIWILDFSFKPEVMAKVLEKTSDVVWIDHHKTAAAYDYGRELKGIRNFGEKETSGCELTWQYLYPGTDIPWCIQRIADRDCWRDPEAPDVKRFTMGMMAEDTSPDSMLWPILLCEAFEDEKDIILKAGDTLLGYFEQANQRMMEQDVYPLQFDGYNCLAVNRKGCGSQSFGDKLKDVDMAICYAYDGKHGKWKVTLYSVTTDVSVVAKAHGGGGHTGAAGFECATLPF